jgi:hypothetical protein
MQGTAVFSASQLPRFTSFNLFTRPFVTDRGPIRKGLLTLFIAAFHTVTKRMSKAVPARTLRLTSLGGEKFRRVGPAIYGVFW